jgi:hypothetical protein
MVFPIWWTRGEENPPKTHDVNVGTDWLESEATLSENLAAKTFAAVKVTACLRPVFVNGTKTRVGIEGDASAVATLVHATRAGVLDDELLWNRVARS